MFAQLLITIVTVWIIAEVLCRLILGPSVASVARELFSFRKKPRVSQEGRGTGATLTEPNASLRQLLTDRQHKLDATSARLELTAEAADVAEQLALREAELAVTEGRLAEVEHRRAGC